MGAYKNLYFQMYKYYTKMMSWFKRLKTFEKITFITFGLSVIVQLILVYNFNDEQISDAKVYLNLARGIIDSGYWYPNVDHLYSSYIFAPGLVNYYAVVLSIFKTEKAILFINVILSAVVCLISYKIAKKHINHTTAIITLFLLSIYPTFSVMPLLTLTELPFMVLSLGAICLILTNKSKYFLIAGLLAVLANWIRPVLPILFIFMLYYIFSTQKANLRAKSAGLFILAAAALIGVIGGITYSKLNHFEYQSTTMGLNLIMGANDAAKGEYDPIVFSEGNIGYIPDSDSITYKYKDAFWKTNALKWIKENPLDWLTLFPNKLFYNFAHDGFFIFGFTKVIPNIEYLKSLINKFPNYTVKDFNIVFLNSYNACIYLFFLILFFMALYSNIKSGNQVVISLIIYCFLFAGATLIAVGNPRYHTPYIPVVIIIVSYYLSTKPRVIKLLRLPYQIL